MRRPLAIGLPLIYAAAVYLATRPPKPVYTLANKTVMTVTAESGPAILTHPDPEYPPQALRDRVEGSVVLKVAIAPDGSVSSAVPLRGPQPLRQAAVDGVRRWQFEPKAVEAEIEVPFVLPRP
jgi:periplasmic protein TonB